MNTVALIEHIRISGGEITLANDSIKLKVPASLHDDAVAQIKLHKNAVKLALKCETVQSWDYDDYRTFFDERAAIAEFDGGSSRAAAEAQALEACIIERLNRHPSGPDPCLCA